MQTLFFGFSIRSIFKKIYQGCVLFGLGFQILVSMETPFNTNLALEEREITRSFLQRQFDLEGSKKRLKGAANTKYGEKLQLLASGLFMQDHFFLLLEKYAKTLGAEENDEFIERCITKSREQGDLYIAIAEYLKLCSVNGELQGLEKDRCSLRLARLKLLAGPEDSFVKAAEFLLQSSFSEKLEAFELLGEFLKDEIDLIKEQTALCDSKKKTIIDVRMCLSVLDMKSLPYVVKVNESNLFIARKLEFMTTVLLLKGQVSLQKILDAFQIGKYRSFRPVYQKLYASSVDELSALAKSKAIPSSVCCRLEDSSELLPGIALEGVSSCLDKQEDFSWTKDGEKPVITAKFKKKQKRKVARAVKKESVGATSVSLQNEGGAGEDEEASQGPSMVEEEYPAIESVAISQFAVQREEAGDVKKKILGQEETFVQAWSVSKVLPRNNQNIQSLLKNMHYTTTINLWLVDPDFSLRTEGYYDAATKNYQRAQSVQGRYQNDDEMRDYMRACHAFPVAIDKKLQKYGCVVEDDSLQVKIRMRGVMKLCNGCEQPGFFTYIIDPVQGQCYHRMFELDEESR